MATSETSSYLFMCRQEKATDASVSGEKPQEPPKTVDDSTSAVFHISESICFHDQTTAQALSNELWQVLDVLTFSESKMPLLVLHCDREEIRDTPSQALIHFVLRTLWSTAALLEKFANLSYKKISLPPGKELRKLAGEISTFKPDYPSRVRRKNRPLKHKCSKVIRAS